MGNTDAALLTRLRDLFLVDVDTLLSGTSDAHYRRLLATYTADLTQALGAARERMTELRAVATSGPDPLSIVDLTSQARAQEAGRDATARAADRLRDRAAACRALAVLDDVARELLPKLLEVDRRSG